MFRFSAFSIGSAWFARTLTLTKWLIERDPYTLSFRGFLMLAHGKSDGLGAVRETHGVVSVSCGRRALRRLTRCSMFGCQPDKHGSLVLRGKYGDCSGKAESRF